MCSNKICNNCFNNVKIFFYLSVINSILFFLQFDGKSNAFKPKALMFLFYG
jgi:hypothetical protein